MDLENFDDIDGLDSPTDHRGFLSAQQALDELDQRWFTLATRRARWMDLLGDYAGAELFLISGESLLERVLDDPLLAIGHDHDASFQILHAYYILETTLLEFVNRRANFEIVFWHVNHHSTINTGLSSFKVASRHLARSLLFEHLMKLDVTVHTFNDLKDPSWLRFECARRPMFVLINHGGVASNSGRFNNERALLQRIFLFQLIDGGMAIGLLNGAEFRDSKILTFVYHGEAHRHTQQRLPKNIFHAADRARSSLDSEVARTIPGQTVSLLSPELRSTPMRSRMVEFSERAIENLGSDSSQLVFLFLLHAAILPELSLLERAQPSQALPLKLMDLLSNIFLPKMFFLASHLPFDVDGRVFLSLLSTATMDPLIPLPDMVGPTVYEEVRAVWSHLSVAMPDFSAFRRRYGGRTDSPRAPAETARRVYKLLPFTHQVFNFDSVFLPDTSVEETPTSTSSSHLDFGIRFSDTTHWHNSKSILPSHLGGEDHKVLDERQRRRENRSNQRFMTTLQKSAATLTGALGTTLQQITIVSAKKTSKDARIPKEHVQPGSSGKKGKPILNSTQKLREKIQQEKAASQNDASYKWWLKELDGLSRLATDHKAVKIQTMFRNKRSEEPVLGLEMRLYVVHTMLRQWIESPEPDSALVRDKFTRSIMKEVKAICDRKALTNSAAGIIDAVLISLGFAGYSSILVSGSIDLPDKPLAFAFEDLLKSTSKKPRYKFMRITEPPVEWQLRLFGEFMDRSMDGAPDSRVSFKPDAWQREVLDCIDKRFSVLVIAPTSAGKTFISYYSMEKILRDSDDGILVYIAPTKALVTQIAAEIYARFKKTLTGKSLWAIHTRDYRVNDPLKCQILVTVPEILATLLLSPPLARVWTPRLKSIILDEIHSIGQQEGGSVWEQIILMAPCPVIGLSATVGSPEDFSWWLESVQTAHGFKYRVIEHPHRYSHLRKFYYKIDDSLPPPFAGLLSHRDTQRSLFLHPISLMSFGIRSIPDDLALEASDTLTLYHTLAKHVPARCEALDPQTFFSSEAGPRLLAQKDVIAYERALKQELIPLLAAGNNGVTTSSDIIRDLQNPQIRSLKDPNTAPSRENYTKNLIFLLSDLHSRGELPAILFSFDRTDCEILAQVLLSTLQTAESKWREEDPKWTEKIHQWEKWLRRAKERERAAEKTAKRRKDEDSPESPLEQEHSWESSFDPNDASPQFSFAGATAYSKLDLAEQIQDLRRYVPEWALQALERGVGVHHAGMNKKYRSLAESLFRQGFIRVMIATGTLALGINAPAKTAVFCGDSPFLTALMYRQCSGRAGRRGFDLLGNVIFYGLPMERVQRLVLSRLPPLGGNFPLTPTLSLRLMNLLSGSNQAEGAVAAVQSILKLPRISFISNIGQEQLSHHMRFSIEYLRRSGLLDKDGRPMDLFSMAAHLYYHEPSNFALVALLKSGALHDICNQSPVAAKKNYIHVMASLFGRRYISQVWASEKNLAAAKRSPSMVVLPDLPKPVRDVLEQHDRIILETFTGYALASAAQLGPDNLLPLSKTSYPDTPQSECSMLRTRLRDTAVRVTARSSFVANSGHTDTFSSVEELARSARSDLHLNGNSIPSMKHLVSHDGHLLNAYLLDFYVHGQVSTLAKANGIRRGDVWYLLQDFSLSLRTIQTSLKKLFMAIPGNDDADETDAQLHDPAEMEDAEDEDEAGGEMQGDFSRPSGVNDRDWRLYTIASEALREFDEKFRAMWA
ncbi:hypothetical protein K438DRAFT_507113 [Mycena galopus ATCC 62051]|nr:hypothetical protein K438DRAFT_507113 [Mycena galopus ATCC 62051]